jgi:hypothetical protein
MQVDLFFYREPEETEKPAEEAAAAEFAGEYGGTLPAPAAADWAAAPAPAEAGFTGFEAATGEHQLQSNHVNSFSFCLTRHL